MRKSGNFEYRQVALGSGLPLECVRIGTGRSYRFASSAIAGYNYTLPSRVMAR